jgi:biopolymer transport protein ExbB/TolQ
LEKNIEEKQERTILETIQVGGVVAWVIVVLGAFGVLLVLMRGLIFASAGLGGQRLTEELAALVAQGQLQAAQALAAQRKGASARVLAADHRARAARQRQGFARPRVAQRTSRMDGFYVQTISPTFRRIIGIG